MNGFYVNLAYRSDRREHFEKLQKDFPFFKNIKRMDAIYSKESAAGCCSSHINCLTECLKLTDKYYLIMEDDFFIFNKIHFNNFIKEFEKIKNDNDWDIITLTPRGTTDKKYFKLGAIPTSNEDNFPSVEFTSVPDKNSFLEVPKPKPI